MAGADSGARQGLLRIGTSSWSEPGWKGSFYPADLPAAGQLPFLAKHFPAVEVDTSYYRVPARSLVAGWRDRTPEGFLLCAKFPRSIVHAGEGAQPDGSRVLVPAAVERDTEAFLEAMAILADKAGPCVLQFPYFNQRAFREPGPFLERLDAFLARLAGRLSVAVELRNPRWIGPELLALLRSRNTALVLAEMPWMPRPWDLGPLLEPFPGDLVYVRLIGDRKVTDALTKRFDRIVVDRSELLEQWAAWLAPALARVPLAFAFANNHFAGHGPATAVELKERLLAHGVRALGGTLGQSLEE